jgi:lipooligosaccharide transport system ATP-binding protein
MLESQQLVVRELSKKYGDTTVVDKLSFSLGAGHILGLLGPNGAGKTTSVGMLYGIVRASSGSATLEPLGKPTWSAAAMHSIGIVTQANNLDPDFCVVDNLRLFGRYHGMSSQVAAERATSVLRSLELEAYGQYRIDQLSGGLERRVVLARALIADPQFILLDEPTTGFDPDIRQLFWRVLLDLRDRGKSILLTTHYMDEAERLCDRVLLLQKGTAIDEGSPRQLIERWIGRNVIEVEGLAAEILTELLPGAELLRFARGYIATVEEDHTGAFARLHQAGARQISVRPATLEDVFLKMQDTQQCSQGRGPQ